MSFHLFWSEQARSDLQHIYDFISEDSIYYAESEIVKITSAMDILYKQPKAGRIVPESGIDSIREIICGNYRVIYELNEEAAYIITVHHGARFLNPANLFL